MGKRIKYRTRSSSQHGESQSESNRTLIMLAAGIIILPASIFVSANINHYVMPEASSEIHNLIYVVVAMMILGVYLYIALKLLASTSLKVSFSRSYVDLKKPIGFIRLRYKKVISYWFLDDYFPEEFGNIYALLEMRTELGDIYQIPVPDEVTKNDILKLLKSKVRN